MSLQKASAMSQWDRFWKNTQIIATLLESTSGKDKVLKLIQYCCKTTLNITAELRQFESIKPTLEYIPPRLLKNLEVIAKQFSLSRKLFRFGRTLHSLNQFKLLYREPNEFLQVMGMCGYFWNALWFICDHSAYLSNIGVITRDPFVPLNRICVVVMQGCLVLVAIRKLAMSFQAEAALIEQLAASNSGAGNVTAAQAASVSGDASQQDETAKRQAQLASIRSARFLLWMDFAKVVGDMITCYDFGFSLNMRPIIPNGAGVVGAAAGLYVEYVKALKKNA